MKKANAKQLRKQGERLIEDSVLPLLNERLDSIEKFCKESLTAQDKRSKAVQGFLVNEVKNKIQEMIFDNQVTIATLVQVLHDSGIVEGLNDKVMVRKPEIRKLLILEAEAAMKKRAEDIAAQQNPPPPTESNQAGEPAAPSAE